MVHLTLVFVLPAAPVDEDVLLAMPFTRVLRSRRMGLPLILFALALFEGVVQNLRSAPCGPSGSLRSGNPTPTARANVSVPTVLR